MYSSTFDTRRSQNFFNVYFCNYCATKKWNEMVP